MLREIAVERYLAGGRGCAAGLLAGASEYYHLGLDEAAMNLFTGFRGGMGCGSTCGSLDCAVIEKRYKVPETRCAAAVALTADLLEEFLAEKGM